MGSAIVGSHADQNEEGFSMLKTRHWVLLAALILLGVPLLWLALAYGGLPKLWSHHERKKMGSRTELISYTAQDLPADPINLRLTGDEPSILCAFKRAGWSLADSLSLSSSIRIASTVLSRHPYPSAPVSPLYFQDRQQDLAFELEEGASAKKRHHVRLWHLDSRDWLAAASFDKGVGLSLYTLQITHHIGPDVDAERRRIANLVVAAGGKAVGDIASGVTSAKRHRNGGGDHYTTDGTVLALMLPPGCAQLQSGSNSAPRPAVKRA
jgi:hypothetical protein